MTQMEDWLGIILGILFILGPALLEKGNRRKKRGQRHERQLQQEEAYGPDPVLRPEMTEAPQSEIRPVYVPVSSEESVFSSEETVLQDGRPVYLTPDTVQERESPQPMSQALPDKQAAVPVGDTKSHAGRKRRINGRDMIIYSEILKPKF